MIIFKKGEKSMEKNWFSKTVTETSEYFKTDLKKGLNLEGVEESRKKYGVNELKAKKKENTTNKILGTI